MTNTIMDFKIKTNCSHTANIILGVLFLLYQFNLLSCRIFGTFSTVQTYDNSRISHNCIQNIPRLDAISNSLGFSDFTFYSHNFFSFLILKLICKYLVVLIAHVSHIIHIETKKISSTRSNFISICFFFLFVSFLLLLYSFIKLKKKKI